MYIITCDDKLAERYSIGLVMQGCRLKSHIGLCDFSLNYYLL